MNKKFNPTRKLSLGDFWWVNLDWIKKEICKERLFGKKVYEDDLGRELLVTKIQNTYGRVGTYVFSLVGSPPKGYAFYIPTSRILIFIGMGGQKIKKFKDIMIKEIGKND